MLVHPGPVATSFSETEAAAAVRCAQALVVVPTYNEADNLPSLLERLSSTADQGNVALDVLIVDDGSPDGTADLAARLQETHPNVHVLVRDQKSGLGEAYRAGFVWGRDRGYDVLVQMDADHSHPVETIPHLLAAISSGADLAIGSRYVHGGATEGWPLSRQLLSRGGNLYVQLLLSLGVQDATAGFRAFRTSLLESAHLLDSVSTGYGFQVEFTWRARRSGCRIEEVPITFTERERGESKMSCRIAAEAVARVTLAALTGGRRGFTIPST